MARRPRLAGAFPELEGLGRIIETRFDTNAGQGAMVAAAAGADLANRLDAVLRRREAKAEAERERAEIEQAGIEGRAAGDADPAARAEGTSPRALAFNRAAAESGLRRLEISTREKLDELARTHAADPAAFQAAAAAYRNGVARGLPQDMAPSFNQGFDSLARPYFNQAGRNAESAVADEAVASFNAASASRIAAIQRLARTATIDPDARRELDRELGSQRADLVALGPRHAFTWRGQQYPADPTRRGALSVQQMEAAYGRADDEANEGIVWGAYLAGPRTTTWIDAWRDHSLGASRRAPDVPIPEPLRAHFQAAAAETGIAIEMLAAVARQESRFDPNIVSPRGAVGVMQILPSTARDPGLGGVAGIDPARLTDAGENIRFGARYLKALIDRYGGNVERALRAYNGGFAREDAGQAPEEAGRYATALAPWHRQGAGPDGLRQEQIDRLASQMRSDAANRSAAAREVQLEARATLQRQIEENSAAVALTGQPVHTLSDDDLRRGYDANEIGRIRGRERYDAASFQARRLLTTARPDEIPGILRDFLPGGTLFGANPAGAVTLLREGEARGEAVQGAALRQQLADAHVSAATTGQVPFTVTADQGRAAGLSDLEVEKANADIAQAARIGGIIRDAPRLSVEEAADLVARLPTSGIGAAGNAEVLRAVRSTLESVAKLRAENPGDAALAFPSVASAWRDAVRDPAQFAAAVAVTRDTQQDVFGTSPDRTVAVPPSVAASLVAPVLAQPDTAGQLRVLADLTAQLPDDASRRQVLDAMVRANLPEHLAVTALLVPRLGQAGAARVAGELATKIADLDLDPAVKLEQTAAVAGQLEGGMFSSGLGALRSRQYEATGNAAFLTLGNRERDLATHLALVRAAPGQSAGSRHAESAIADLFGGRRVIDRPGDGIAISAPAGLDAGRLVAGLNILRRQMLDAYVPPGSQDEAQRRRLLDGTWVDAGTGAVAFYPRGSGTPLQLPETIGGGIAVPIGAVAVLGEQSLTRAGSRRETNVFGEQLIPRLADRPEAPRSPLSEEQRRRLSEPPALLHEDLLRRRR